MKLSALPLFSVVTAGCATSANPPSLMPRAIEIRAQAVADPAPVSTPREITPTQAATIKALLIEARAGDAEFAKAQSSGSNALVSARNAASGSEAWIAGELVISALQVARQRSAGALSEIDTLAINTGDLAIRDATVGGLFEISAAQTEIAAIVARQTARLESLSR